MKILYAEDDLNISKIAIMALKQIGGHEIVHCSNGQLLLEAYNLDSSFDLILLDEMMPELNGIQACETLLKKGCTAPVVFMSANAHAEAIAAFKRMGAEFIPKPFDPMTLNDQLKQCVQKLTGGQ